MTTFHGCRSWAAAIILSGAVSWFVLPAYETMLGLQLFALQASVGAFLAYQFLVRKAPGSRISACLLSVAVGLGLMLSDEAPHLENTVGGARLLLICCIVGASVGLVVAIFLMRGTDVLPRSRPACFRYAFLFALLGAQSAAVAGSKLNRYLASPAVHPENYELVDWHRIEHMIRYSSKNYQEILPPTYLADVRIGGRVEALNIGRRRIGRMISGNSRVTSGHRRVRRVVNRVILAVTTRHGLFGYPVVEQIRFYARGSQLEQRGRPGDGRVAGGESLVAVGFEPQATDADLAGLKQLHEDLTHLHTLDLSDTRITDAGLRELKEFPSLRELYLSNTRITDAGLKELKHLKYLEALLLSGPGITDAELMDLKELTSLEWLWLAGTEVTRRGEADLRAANPRLREVHVKTWTPP